MAFQTFEGFEYSTPVTWHADPVYRVESQHGGPFDGGDLNHAVDFYNSAARFEASSFARASYSESFGGPHPGNPAMACAWSKAQVGAADEGNWTGSCPTDLSPSETYGSLQGSTWNVRADAVSELLIPEVSSATAIIAGYALTPWTIHSDYDEFMYDDALHDEFLAAAAATRPGDDWALQMEAFHPFFESFQVAPDELVVPESPGTRVGGVTWFRDPPRIDGVPFVWAFYGYDTDGEPIWGTNRLTEGTVLAEYSGGVADWVDVPDEWQPTQIDHISTIGFIEPEDPNTATIPLTLVSDRILGSTPDPNTSGGRVSQAMLIRAAWRLPRFRWFRERTYYPSPVRVIGRKHDGLAAGGNRTVGRNTIQRSNRTLGAQR